MSDIVLTYRAIQQNRRCFHRDSIVYTIPTLKVELKRQGGTSESTEP